MKWNVRKNNLSNLNTQITITTNMFFECKQLKNIQYMFYGCESFEMINCTNFKIKDNNKSNFNMFSTFLKFKILE